MSLENISGVINGQDLEDNFANIASGELMHYNAEWTSYTPIWTCDTGTAPSIGNGTILGRYIKIGTLVIVQIKFTAGSTTTFGNGGAWNFSLPFNNSTTDYPTNHHAIGNCYIEDLATVGYNGVVRLISTQQNKAWPGSLSATGTYAGGSAISNTNPFTWATGDFLSMQFFYESEE